MGEISTDVLRVAAGWLIGNIVRDYDCVPQIILDVERVGFNVDGREVGRVGRGEDGDVYGIFYAFGSQPMGSVFSK